MPTPPNPHRSRFRFRIDPSIIQSLPLYTYDDNIKDTSNCPICLTEFEDKDMIKVIPFSCPLCRCTQLVLPEVSIRPIFGRETKHQSVHVTMKYISGYQRSDEDRWMAKMEATISYMYVLANEWKRNGFQGRQKLLLMLFIDGDFFDADFFKFIPSKFKILPENGEKKTSPFSFSSCLYSIIIMRYESIIFAVEGFKIYQEDRK
ncbi:hypothetical protein NE237_030748 [Protea cynaroides]|uniref:Uncharacterized protein n=1 Tax=Protea cynaroides TaxID=273540 RepID=A0A9Q0GTL5_9MAGN|nr:hypothetical protein NE237_030748 [Protea cynaroides]